jgi:hypothetical protein
MCEDSRYRYDRNYNISLNDITMFKRLQNQPMCYFLLVECFNLSHEQPIFKYNSKNNILHKLENDSNYQTNSSVVVETHGKESQ